MESSTTFRTSDFSEEDRLRIQETLQTKLERDSISQRAGPGGAKLSYVESWKAIEIANKLFGYNGWSCTILDMKQDYCDQNAGKINVGYTAIVRVFLKDGTSHEDIGFGHSEGGSNKALAIEKAKKEAVSDARKRALRLFGNYLGNSVYDKSHIKSVMSVSKNQQINSSVTPNGLNRTQTAPLNIQNHSKQSNAQALDRPAKRQIVEWSERGHLDQASGSSNASSFNDPQNFAHVASAGMAPFSNGYSNNHVTTPRPLQIQHNLTKTTVDDTIDTITDAALFESLNKVEQMARASNTNGFTVQHYSMSHPSQDTVNHSHTVMIPSLPEKSNIQASFQYTAPSQSEINAPLHQPQSCPSAQHSTAFNEPRAQSSICLSSPQKSGIVCSQSTQSTPTHISPYSLGAPDFTTSVTSNSQSPTPSSLPNPILLTNFSAQDRLSPSIIPNTYSTPTQVSQPSQVNKISQTQEHSQSVVPIPQRSLNSTHAQETEVFSISSSIGSTIQENINPTNQQIATERSLSSNKPISDPSFVGLTNNGIQEHVS